MVHLVSRLARGGQSELERVLEQERGCLVVLLTCRMLLLLLVALGCRALLAATLRRTYLLMLLVVVVGVVVKMADDRDVVRVEGSACALRGIFDDEVGLAGALQAALYHLGLLEQVLDLQHGLRLLAGHGACCVGGLDRRGRDVGLVLQMGEMVVEVVVVQALVVDQEGVGGSGGVRVAEVATALQERCGQAEAAGAWMLIAYQGDTAYVRVVGMSSS